MSTLAFSLILFSALMHALWNLLVKRSRDKTIYIWWMFLVSATLFTATLPFLPGPFPMPSPRIFALAAGGGLCFVLYHIANGQAYHRGDLSLVYPLAQTSMLYVPIWGALLLGEVISGRGLGGIALVISGVWCVQLRHLSLAEALRPLRSLNEDAVRYALFAGFIYSVGAVIDKTGVTDYSPLYFTYLLVIFMLVFMTLNLLRPRYRGRILAEWQHNPRLILIAGPVMMGSFLTFRYGLKLAPLSYAVPTRQVSILLGVLIGTLFLGEACGRIRLFAGCTILAGVILIRFS
jgi:drug/metabolite transporter (DMT)-like permease